MSTVTRFGVSIPSELLRPFDDRIERMGYRTRSEAIRDIMREFLVEGEWEESGEQVVGTVTLVYDHHTRELTNVLNKLQHGIHDAVVCATHVHLDEYNCLEVIVIRGSGDEVRAAADRLISTRGVKHGKLVCTTTGEHVK